jgi:GNAT superfamily N-acetyltransferase
VDDRDQTSEAIERAALVSLHEHCPAETREALGLFLEEVEDAVVAGASRDPSTLLNRALGLGTQTPTTRASVEAIQAVYAAHGVGRYFVHVYPTTLAAGPGTLDGLPLAKARGWQKFFRPDAPALDRATELRLEEVGPQGAADFGRIVAQAFGMFVDGQAGWLEWGATDPAFRRRGSQGAIMAARIRRARELGCQVLFTETGESVEGDPQHSYKNIQRSGFQESVLRENWAPSAG